MRGLLTSAALLLASGTAQAAAPDLAACPKLDPTDTGERLREAPLPVPRALAGVVRADMDHYAVTTLGGTTVCVDARFMEAFAVPPALSADGRFLSLAWQGYEGAGHVLVDRSGKGDDIETGAEPLFSPSRRRLAAVEWSESGFGTLNGFAVWQVESEGFHELARIQNGPFETGELDGAYYPEWRLDRWVGENCAELTGKRLNRATGALSPVRFAAREAGGWKPVAAPQGCAAR